MRLTLKPGTGAVRLASLVFAVSIAATVRAELPPLIDRNLLFGEVEIAHATISPDGQYLAFLKPRNGVRNIWVKGLNESFDSAHPITNDTKRPISGFFWSRDSKVVLYVQDNGGDENFNLFAADPAGKTPVRNLTGIQGVRVQIYSVPRDKPGVVFVGLNDRDKKWHDLYRLDLASGKRTLLKNNTEQVADWLFDNAGELRGGVRTNESGGTDVLRFGDGPAKVLFTCSVEESCHLYRFDKANRNLYLTSDKGDDVNLSQLETLDFHGGSVAKVEADPEGTVDFDRPIFSEKTDKLLATSYQGSRLRWYFHDPQFESDYRWLKGRLPDGELSFDSATSDEEKWIVSFASDVEPGITYLFDRKDRKLEQQFRFRDKLNRGALSNMRAITYKSSDGLEIPAYLTLPKGAEDHDLPLIALPHGGPWGRDGWQFNSMVQFLANRGYAVLQPNFRGSTGYGKKFLNAGNGEWGRKMQDDITWGVKHLVNQGTANRARVGIAGGSYGGYATLAGVAFTPNLYAAAVSIVGPSNIITLLEATPPYWESIRKMLYKRIADPTTPVGRKLLESESPLFAAKQIRTPLMVVQGANDPRVNKRESDQIVAAVRDAGKPITYLVAPDEGHGFARPINNLAMVTAMEKFLAKQLDGRAQENVPDDVAKRLAEITVDPATVKLAQNSAAR